MSIMTFAAAVAACAAIAVPANSTTWDMDYMEEMVSAAIVGDYEVGEAAAEDRNEKIERYGLDYPEIEFEDLYLLSKIMYAEAGSYWLSDEWKMCVGEVVLNRVASPEFPNSVPEVLAQPGQYYGTGCSYFEKMQPNETCVRLAIRLLEGDRVLNDPSVLFQANFKQAGGVHTKLYDPQLGYSYFCYSIRPHLYDDVEKGERADIPELIPNDDERFTDDPESASPEYWGYVGLSNMEQYVYDLRRTQPSTPQE